MMIKPTELRIGNIVQRRDEECTVRSIGQEDIWVRFGGEYGDHEMWYYKSVDPVPLTEEWLVRLGFERDAEKDCNEYLAFRPTTAHYSVRMFINDQGISNPPGHVCMHYLGCAISTNHPQFLHQFQNLYFALTGEELTLKETV